MSESETHQIQGVCDGFMQRGDWQEFHINIGRQYPVKLATKQPNIKEAATAAGQQQAVWTYNETQGKENPHRPGEFFKNRYLNKVEVGGTLSPEAAAKQNGGGKTTGVSTDSERRSIERQTIVKAAISLYPDGLVKTDAEWFTLLTAIAAFVAQAPPPVTATPAEDPNPQPENPDDDIPF